MKPSTLKLVILMSAMILLFGCPRRRHSPVRVIYVQSPNDMSISSSTNYEEQYKVALTQTIDVDLSDSDFETIAINIAGIMRRDITISSSDTNEINLSMTIVAATQAELDTYRNSVQHDTANGRLAITSNMERQHCGLMNINQVLRVNGICLSSINISIPQNMRTQIYFKNMPLRLEISDIADFNDSLSRTSLSDNEKVDYIKEFAQTLTSRNQTLTTSQLVTMLLTINNEYYRFNAFSEMALLVRTNADANLIVATMSSDDKKSDTVKLMLSKNILISIEELLNILNGIRSTYYKQQVINAYFNTSNSNRINSEDFHRILESISQDVSSLNDIFTLLITRVESVNLVRELALTNNVYYKNKMLEVFGRNAPRNLQITSSELESILNSMQADSDKLTSLEHALPRVNGRINAINLLSTIRSDYYKNKMIEKIISAGRAGDISSAEALIILQTVNDNSSRYEMLEALKNANIQIDPIAAISLFNTDYYRERVQELMTN